MINRVDAIKMGALDAVESLREEWRKECWEQAMSGEPKQAATLSRTIYNIGFMDGLQAVLEDAEARRSAL